MAVPYVQRLTVMAGDEAASTTKEFHTASSELDGRENAGGGVPYAHSYIVEVFGDGSANFTLDFQGKPHVSGTYTNLDYQQIWQAGAAALSNGQLTVNDTTHRFYLIPNASPFVQSVATRTAGELTIYAWLTSEPLPQWLLTTARGSVFIEGPIASDGVAAGNPVQQGGVVDDTSPTAAAEGDVRSLRATPEGNLIVEVYKDNVASAGASMHFDADGDNTAQAIKTASGKLWALEVSNPNSADAYLQLFDVATGSVTVGTTVPALSLLVPAGDGTKDGAMDKNFPMSIEFGTAITYACTTTPAGSGDPSTGLIVNAVFS